MLKHLRLLIILSVFLFSGCQSFAPLANLGVESTFQPPVASLEMDTVLEIDSNIRYGVLENGLTYYVRHNREPANRAELWLAINAGSLVEDEDQLGLAHFLEHMLFNGTERFPEQALINFFETVGMTFGPDINAYTSFDETVYQLRFPTDDEEIVRTAFEVLEDWAAYATIDPVEVEAERGVVVEEERLRDQNAGGRVRNQIIPVLLGDSRYAARLPIGDMEIIRTAPADALRRFYEDWYRPDLMAVVAVGDFDVDEFEALIIEHFSDLPQPEEPRERPTFDVPGHDETRYLVIGDPEYPVSIVEISYKQESHEGQTVGDYRQLLVQFLFNYLFNFRLDEISRQADSPFIAAYYNRGSLVRPMDSIDIGAQVRDEEILEGMDGILTEVERIRRHGFTESELERAKNAVLSFYRRMYNNRENWDSESYAAEYLRNFFVNEPIPGIARELQIAEALLPGITLAEVNDLVEALVGEENRTIIVIAPEKADLVLPQESELAAVLAAAEEKDLDPYVDVDVAGELVSEVPLAVDVVSSNEIEMLGITEIELANGVRVILKPTNFTQQVIFAGVSPGGSSLVADEEYWEAAFISNIVSESGLGDYERTELNRLLTGRGVGVSPSIDELTESIGGGAPPDELEPLFQLIYLYFTAPRADEAAFSTFQDQVRAFLRNRGLTPSAALQDALMRIRYGDSLRHSIPTVDQINDFDLERAFEIYQERFADASDFTFVFVGDFDVNVMIDYAQTYLGNLPTLDREESWQNVQSEPPGGVIAEAVYAGQEQQSIVQMLFTGPFDPDYETGLRLRALETVLDILIREELRERRGGVYGYFASASQESEPQPLYTAQIAFSTDPGRVDELIEATFELIAQIQNEGPSAELMTIATAQMMRQRELALEDNSFWLEQLVNYALDAETDLHRILSYDEDVRALTAAEIQALAQEILRDDQYIQVVLYPRAMQP
ncbi:MAG: insulinase family protein [Caldilineaceae bacterium]|nr:insulinase family protein [Caldilineaceae bacterium]